MRSPVGATPAVSDRGLLRIVEPATSLLLAIIILIPFHINFVAQVTFLNQPAYCYLNLFLFKEFGCIIVWRTPALTMTQIKNGKTLMFSNKGVKTLINIWLNLTYFFSRKPGKFLETSLNKFVKIMIFFTYDSVKDSVRVSVIN